MAEINSLIADAFSKKVIGYKDCSSYTIANPASTICSSFEVKDKSPIDSVVDDGDQIQREIKVRKEEKKKMKLKNIQFHNARLRSLIKHVHWSGNTCIVYWRDNTQTKAHWDIEEDFDPEKAILVCMARKLYENTGLYNEVIEKYSKAGWEHYYNNLPHKKDLFDWEWNV